MAQAPELASALMADIDVGIEPRHIREVFARYASAHSAGDVDGIMALFAPDAVIHDPANGPEQRGSAALRSFFVAGIVASGRPIDEAKLKNNSWHH